MVEKPEEYRWSSIGYHVQRENEGGLLSLDFGLAEFGEKNTGERLKRYRKFLYEKGGGDRGQISDDRGKEMDQGQRRARTIAEKTLEVERERDFKLGEFDKFRYRTRYFIDSGIIGSREFVDPPASPA